MSQPFDAWSFCRDAISRGTAIERHCEAQGLGYESLSARMDAAASEFANRLKPHLAAVRADDGEPVTGEWLKAVGFGAGETTEGEAIPAPNLPLQTIHEHRTGLAIDTDQQVACVHMYGEGVVPVPFPATRGHVRRLCSALGVQIKESA